jgi:hypothetical protein
MLHTEPLHGVTHQNYEPKDCSVSLGADLQPSADAQLYMEYPAWTQLYGDLREMTASWVAWVQMLRPVFRIARV